MGKAGPKPPKQESTGCARAGAAYAGARRAKEGYGERQCGKMEVGIRSWKSLHLLNHIKELVFTIWTMGALECHKQWVA